MWAGGIQVRPVMVTGDNAQCGHYISKQCMMIAPDVRVLLGDIDADGRYSSLQDFVKQYIGFEIS